MSNGDLNWITNFIWGSSAAQVRRRGSRQHRRRAGVVDARERRVSVPRIRFRAVESALRQKLEERSGAHGRQGGHARSAFRDRARGRCRIQPRHKVERRADAVPGKHAFQDEARHAAGQPHRRGSQRLVAVHRRCRRRRKQCAALDYRERLAGSHRGPAAQHVLQYRHRDLCLGAEQP
jgi:hypothetical protein